VVSAGLIMGNYGKAFSMSPTTRLTLLTFWEFAVFLVNSLVFLIIGLDIHIDKLTAYSREIAIAVSLSVISRALAVYPIINLVNLRLKPKIPILWQHVNFWGGLHGTIPVALALGLAEEHIAGRDLIASMTFGVVLFSLVVQGLSVELFIKRSSIIRREPVVEDYEEKLGRAIAVKEGIREIRKLLESGEIADEIAKKIRAELEGEADRLSKEIAILTREDVIKLQEKAKVKRRVLLAQRSAVHRAMVRGIISEHIARKLIEEINERIEL